MQSIPGVGDTSEYAPVDDAGAHHVYAQKHDPFMYFADIRQNASRMKKIVPFSQFDQDIAGHNVPNFVWISPDQCNDMHGAGSDPSVASMPGCAGGDTTASVIVQGDAFLKDTVKKIMASPAWSEGAAIVIVWDEDDYAGTAGCCNSPVGVSVDGGAGVLGGAQVPAIVISSKISTPVMSNDPYNHYSLLATIQNLWGFGCLANTCGMSLTTDDEALRAVRA